MENNQIKYRTAEQSEIDDIRELITSVFDQYVAPAYTQEGKEEFHKYIQPVAIKERLHKDHFMLVAEAENEIVGIIEIRNCDHVSLLFVSSQWQRMGIAGTLLQKAIVICQQQISTLETITVNASPNSVPIYGQLGFEETAEEKEINGIRFTPMTLQVRP